MRWMCAERKCARPNPRYRRPSGKPGGQAGLYFIALKAAGAHVDAASRAGLKAQRQARASGRRMLYLISVYGSVVIDCPNGCNCSPRQRDDMGGVGADDVADRL